MSNVEAEILMNARTGDQEAFSHLVDAYQKPVFNLCFRMMGDAAEAEDAAQETFIRAYQSIRRFDQNRSFITWLLSIAAHYCIDQLRKRRMLVLPLEVLPEETVPDQVADPESKYTRQETQEMMRNVLSNLNPQDRAAIILRYWYDFSEEEIAQTLSLTVGAVKSRLHRSRKELARLWLDHHPDTQKTNKEGT